MGLWEVLSLPIIFGLLASDGYSIASASTGSPEGRWSGTLQCLSKRDGCIDAAVDLTLSSAGHDQGYVAQVHYLRTRNLMTREDLEFDFKPEKRVLSARSINGDRREFWTMRLDGDSLDGVRLVNGAVVDRAIVLTRVSQP